MNLGLACWDQGRQAPFEQITAKQSDFVHANYLPSNIKLKDP